MWIYPSRQPDQGDGLARRDGERNVGQGGPRLFRIAETGLNKFKLTRGALAQHNTVRAFGRGINQAEHRVTGGQPALQRTIHCGQVF